MPICEIHNCEMRWRDAGVSKSTGKPYPGFWSCPQRNADGSYCKFKPTEPATPDQKFDRELDTSAAKWDNSKKDETITRLAVIKSVIERGDKYSTEVVEECEKWVEYAKKGKAAVSQPQENNGNGW